MRDRWNLMQLSAPAVRKLFGTWPDDGSRNDIQILTDQFLAAQESDTMAGETQVAWHHFAVAIGNFKRPGGRIWRLTTVFTAHAGNDEYLA